MSKVGEIVTEMDTWDAEYPKTELRRGELVSTDRVRGSVRYLKNQYATNEDLEETRKKVSRMFSRKR